MEQIIPIDEEYIFGDGVIMSETDLKGIITYANRKFCEVSGYDRKELKGKNQNVIRHPDMPKEIFKRLWETIENGQEWTGIVKNLRRNGQYYWVHSFISPVIKDGITMGYVAARRQATKLEIEEAEENYGLR